MSPRKKGIKGVTLVELTITAALLAAVALMVMGPFRFLAMSTQRSKIRTLANNLAQEQIEILKNKSYYSLLVTTSTYNDTRFSPAIDYDNAGNPIENMTEGGIPFIRATMVEFAFQSGATISTAPWTSEDTGLKQLTVYVLYQQDGVWKYISLQNLVSNTSTTQLNARITGSVTRQGVGTNIQGAYVYTIENPNFYATTNAGGAYTINVSSGSYTVTCSSTPFYSTTTLTSVVVGSGGTATQNFVLTAIASAAVSTDIYLQDHPVISQVVAATHTLGTDLSDHDIEYVELYNPTPNSVNISELGHVNWKTEFRYYDENPGFNRSDAAFNLVYVTTYIPAGGHYLIMNSPTAMLGGAWVTADAYYTALYTNYIRDDKGGSVVIGNHVTGTVYDTVGWEDSTNPAPQFETNDYPNVADGMQNSQLVRLSTPGWVSATYGPAYDSNNNDIDFARYDPIVQAPKNTTNILPAITGTPATGAWMNLTDTFSQGGVCSTVIVGGIYPVCRLSVYAATGTWTAIAYSLGSTTLNYYKQFDNVVVGGSNINIPNATTSPVWPANPYSHTLLNTTTNYAFVAGTVYNAFGSPLNGIAVTSNGQTTTTPASGRYFLSLPSGAVGLTANPNNGNPIYSSEVLNIVAPAGSLTDSQNFFLAQAGVLRGYFKTSSNVALPNRTAVALQGATEMGQASSDGSGVFYIKSLSTGTYTVQPALDPAESVSPSSVTVTLAAPGTTVFVGSFTVTNGLAQITGSVLAGGAPIKTGVLVVATTATLAGAVPSLTGSSGCSPCYYEAASDAVGNYVIPLRSSASNYKVYGWYTTFLNGVSSTTRAGPYTVSVATAATTVSQNLTW